MDPIIAILWDQVWRILLCPEFLWGYVTATTLEFLWKKKKKESDMSIYTDSI